MEKKVIVTDAAPAPVGPYSQAIKLGDFLYCSGQIAIEPSSGDLLTSNIAEETEQVMKNIGAVLAANNMSYQNIFKTSIFLIRMSDFNAVNEVYSKYFKDDPPARSCVAVSELPKGVNVEIEVIAHVAQ
tara:strand:- start:24631 stop:25017 length:387 start_codon:yes stop_codon:yes gene_type:complete